MAKRKAVFLDRDGVINRVIMRAGIPGSPRAPREFRLRRGAAAFVRRLKGKGFAVFVITNQPDVARGLLDPAELEKMHGRLRKAMPVDGVLVCPHDDGDGCACRKPLPGLILAAAGKHGIDLAGSFVFGDGRRDMAAGRAAGCTTILLRTGYNRGVEADHRVRGFAETEKIIQGQRRAPSRIVGGAFMPRCMKKTTHSEKFLAGVRAVAAKIPSAALEEMAKRIARIRDRDGRLFFLGVGGSAAAASHAVNDFRKIAGIESYAPTDNASELTARVNDSGWESVFVEWLKVSRLGGKDGVFILSVGGGDEKRGVSVNLVEAIRFARSTRSAVLSIVGRPEGYAARHADACVVVPAPGESSLTAFAESFQAVLLHLLVTHPSLQKSAMKWESLKKTSDQSSVIGNQ